MECTISVPTTINEESSRHNSLVPQEVSRHNSLVPSCGRASPCPSINAITEASESVESDNNDADTPLMPHHTYHAPTALVSPANYGNNPTDSRFSNSDIPLQVLSSSNTLLPPAVVV